MRTIVSLIRAVVCVSAICAANAIEIYENGDLETKLLQKREVNGQSSFGWWNEIIVVRQFILYVECSQPHFRENPLLTVM